MDGTVNWNNNYSITANHTWHFYVNASKAYLKQDVRFSNFDNNTYMGPQSIPPHIDELFPPLNYEQCCLNDMWTIYPLIFPAANVPGYGATSPVGFFEWTEAASHLDYWKIDGVI